MLHSECHAHFVLDGEDFHRSLARHREGRGEEAVRSALAAYRAADITRVRDGGDHFGAGLLARKLGPEYGVEVLSPAFAIHKNDTYGAMVGMAFDTISDYRTLLAGVKAEKGDFVKLMISGIVDFARWDVMSCDPLPKSLVRELVDIAHAEGFRVMAHANREAVLTALECGIDSVEHGYYAPAECADAFAETGAVYVPTLATSGNLLGQGRFPDEVVRRIHEAHCAFAALCAGKGALVACGSDAGAWRVLHGQGALDERAFLLGCGIPEAEIDRADDAVFERFSQ